jgi:uncharacterized membrane protein
MAATSWRGLLMAELRFTAPFAFYIAMRGFSHDLIGLEKFMDLAFVNAATQTMTLPAPDPWFAGQPINYYYFGHYLAALICKLSAVPPAFGYNLMLATLFGGVFQLAYAFVAEMTGGLSAPLRNGMALVAAAWLTVGGNIHGFLYGFIKPWLVDANWVDKPRQAFLLSDPTRFVGWDPPTGDKLIHEFPAYAFYVGDLHAHLINLPQVLLLLCVLLQWQRERGLAHGQRARMWLLSAAALVGTFAMANSWDALMYASMLGGLLAFHGVSALGTGVRATLASILDGALAACVTALVAAPFLLHFQAHSACFHATHSHTPVWQWLILYGLPALLAIAGSLLTTLVRGDALGCSERRMLVAMTAFGIVFALVPELVYIKDIYGADFYRGNTAFKFGFQAFTLLTLAACVALGLLVAHAPRSLPRFAVVALLELVLVPPLYYAWFVLQGGFGVWREREWTLDGQRFIALSYPEDQAAIRWLAQQPRGQVLLEAVGDSYTYGARIATSTGMANVLGWPVHEQLWRGSNPEVWRRRDDVAALYQAREPSAARAVLARYRPRWLIVGRYERERYPELNEQLLAGLGRVAFRNGDTFIVELEDPARSLPAA